MAAHLRLPGSFIQKCSLSPHSYQDVRPPNACIADAIVLHELVAQPVERDLLLALILILVFTKLLCLVVNEAILSGAIIFVLIIFFLFFVLVLPVLPIL